VVYLALGCRALIGLVFAVSAVAKLRSRPAFRSFTSWLAALPLPLVRGRPTMVATAMAGTEIVVVVLVAVPASARAGLLLAAAVLAVLAAGVHIALRRGANAPCRCFGATGATGAALGPRHVARNLLLCAAAAAGGAAATGSAGQPAGIGISLGAGAAVALVVIFLDDLVAVLGDLHLSALRPGGIPHGVPGCGGRRHRRRATS